MDGLFHGKPYEQMDDLGGKNHYFWKHPYTGRGGIGRVGPLDSHK